MAANSPKCIFAGGPFLAWATSRATSCGTGNSASSSSSTTFCPNWTSWRTSCCPPWSPRRSIWPSSRARPRKQEALRLIEAFGLKDRIRHRPGQLSGGERQRVAIARALINQPALLLADEPTGNLDAKTGRTILDVLVNLHKERGQTMLLVTHDPNVAKLADRTVNLVDGRIRGA